eukprot:gene2961-12968_t
MPCPRSSSLQNPEKVPLGILTSNYLGLCWVASWWAMNYSPYNIPSRLFKFRPVKAIARACVAYNRANQIMSKVDIASELFPGVALAPIVVGTMSGCASKFCFDLICQYYGVNKEPHEASAPTLSWRSVFLGTVFYYVTAVFPSPLRFLHREEASAIFFSVFVFHSIPSTRPHTRTRPQEQPAPPTPPHEPETPRTHAPAHPHSRQPQTETRASRPPTPETPAPRTQRTPHTTSTRPARQRPPTKPQRPREPTPRADHHQHRPPTHNPHPAHPPTSWHPRTRNRETHATREPRATAHAPRQRNHEPATRAGRTHEPLQGAPPPATAHPPNLDPRPLPPSAAAHPQPRTRAPPPANIPVPGYPPQLQGVESSIPPQDPSSHKPVASSKQEHEGRSSPDGCVDLISGSDQLKDKANASGQCAADGKRSIQSLPGANGKGSIRNLPAANGKGSIRNLLITNGNGAVQSLPAANGKVGASRVKTEPGQFAQGAMLQAQEMQDSAASGKMVKAGKEVATGTGTAGRGGQSCQKSRQLEPHIGRAEVIASQEASPSSTQKPTGV